MVPLRYFIGGIAAILLIQCGTAEDCRAPVGKWSDQQGRSWIFEPDGKALWITRFGSQSDTQSCSYKLDCERSPALLVMENFDAGPFTGRSVLAIFEWSNDSTLRFQYGDGSAIDAFDVELAAKLIRE